ncbi:hemerythrin HHE cation binding domain-containing protein [Ahrensia sp. R2A130]|nr:hemerythrin HHE cation binding domain-containing protein [Ahrensia sp. R2A130]
MKQAHEFEETQFFPLLEQRAGRESVAEGIERLRYEHWEDEDYAEEISQTLGLLGRGEPVGSVDKVSWLLRGFFSGVRRHIAYETDHFLPMLDAEAMSQAPA